jgi:hypothetical protein
VATIRWDVPCRQFLHKSPNVARSGGCWFHYKKVHVLQPALPQRRSAHLQSKLCILPSDILKCCGSVKLEAVSYLRPLECWCGVQPALDSFYGRCSSRLLRVNLLFYLCTRHSCTTAPLDCGRRRKNEICRALQWNASTNSVTQLYTATCETISSGKN